MITHVRASLPSEPFMRQSVRLGIYRTEGERLLVGSLTYQEEPEGAFTYEPTTSISIEAAQTLMDDLWACGLRPTEGAGSAGALAATQNHLADMRKIAFDLLNKR